MLVIKPVAPKARFKALVAGIYVLVIKSLSTSTLERKNTVVPWTDATTEHKVTLECSEGAVVHQFHEAGYVSKDDYEKDGIFEGRAVPKDCEFLSSENNAGNEENYLCQKLKDGTWKRIAHNASKVSIDGKVSIMLDAEIDKLINNGVDVTFVKESKSRVSQRMFNEFAYLTGVQPKTPGAEITFSDFEGLQIGAKIETKPSGENDYSFVKYFMSVEDAEAKVAKLSDI